MSTTPNPQLQATLLPAVSIQPTFVDVITEVRDGIIPFDKFWVSCYKKDAESVHANVRAELDEKDRNKVLLKSDKRGVTVQDEEGTPGSGQVYKISCESLDIPATRIILPRQEYRDVDRADSAKPHRITAFAVAPDNTRYATGYLDGSIHIYPTSPSPSNHTSSSPHPIEFPSDSPKKVYSKAHLSTVSTLKFFPSSRVILSSGNDFTVNILSAELPPSPPTSSSSTRVQPVRTFRAHTRPVTSTEILGVGRTVVSASLDSKLKIWDVPTGEAVHTLYSRDGSGILTTCAHKTVVEDGVATTEDETRVYAALTNGSVEVFDLRAGEGWGRGSIASFRPMSSSSSGSLTAIACSGSGPNDGSGHLLACGSSGGEVRVFDIRSSFDTPLASFRRLDAGVASLSFFGHQGSVDTEARLAVGTTDGLPCVVNIPVGSEPWTPSVLAEIVGVDCDAVRHVSVNSTSGNLWTGSDDGVVRMYELV